MTRLWASQPRNRVRFLTGAKFLPLPPQNIETRSGACSASSGPGPGGSLSRREADRCLPCNATRLYDDKIMYMNA